MRVGVIGRGVEGTCAESYWTALGATVETRDADDGQAYLDGLDAFDLVVRSPGIHPNKLRGAANVTSCTREFFARWPGRVVGITGTKGKSTTTALLGAMLDRAGLPVAVGGNIGTAALDLLSGATPEHVAVLELSSFQLMDAETSPDVAVLLAITSDHLDWHADLAEYVEAKAQLVVHQAPDDIVFWDAGDPRTREVAERSAAEKRPCGVGTDTGWGEDGVLRIGGEPVLERADVALRGPHNLRNVCIAAATAYELTGGNVAAIAAAVRSFAPLSYRLEPVETVEGVLFVNDSGATMPDAAAAAVAAFDEPKVLILGGSSKEAPSFEPLAAVVAASNVRHVLCIGRESGRIGDALDSVGYAAHSPGPSTMPEIVAAAHALAQAGDVVLLSPGCASFDMFRNAADRAAQFAGAVRALAAAGPTRGRARTRSGA